MKVFVTQCRVGNFVAEGEGNGKKISKKRAAEKMLEELSKLPPLPTMNNLSQLKRKRVTNKKKTRNLIKVVCINLVWCLLKTIISILLCIVKKINSFR